jgi:hypothetical protein
MSNSEIPSHLFVNGYQTSDGTEAVLSSKTLRHLDLIMGPVGLEKPRIEVTDWSDREEAEYQQDLLGLIRDNQVDATLATLTTGMIASRKRRTVLEQMRRGEEKLKVEVSVGSSGIDSVIGNTAPEDVDGFSTSAATDTSLLMIAPDAQGRIFQQVDGKGSVVGSVQKIMFKSDDVEESFEDAQRLKEDGAQIWISSSISIGLHFGPDGNYEVVITSWCPIDVDYAGALEYLTNLRETNPARYEEEMTVLRSTPGGNALMQDQPLNQFATLPSHYDPLAKCASEEMVHAFNAQFGDKKSMEWLNENGFEVFEVDNSLRPQALHLFVISG